MSVEVTWTGMSESVDGLSPARMFGHTRLTSMRTKAPEFTGIPEKEELKRLF